MARLMPKPADPNRNDVYCIYLRKSREDMEAERRGEVYDVLARHRKTLLELAVRRGYPIGEIYEEVVSGESIQDRPEVQRLLSDIESRRWAGVLVTEVHRLARGDTSDQGLIAKTFKYSSTLIITPEKTFDPNDEADEEYFEFGLFMSRREYKGITRRLWNGRIRSVKDGNYIGGPAPFGYARKYLPGTRDWTLEIVPEKAAVVRDIFNWYAYGMNGVTVGADTIARHLNEVGWRSDNGKMFDGGRIRAILQNPTYAGLVHFNRRRLKVSMVDGQRVKTRPLSDEYFQAKGKHEPIVALDLFEYVQNMFRARAKSCVSSDKKMVNPLAGLLKCSICGRTMVIRGADQYGRCFLRCVTPDCPCVGINVEVCERVMLSILREWTMSYIPQPDSIISETTAPSKSDAAARQRLLDQLSTLDIQRSRLMDLLEQGVYSNEEYLSRKRDLSARVAEITAALAKLDEVPADPMYGIERIIPTVERVLEAYPYAQTAEEKNTLLRAVISHAIYDKTKRVYRNQLPDKHLTLTIFPLIPK